MIHCFSILSIFTLFQSGNGNLQKWSISKVPKNNSYASPNYAVQLQPIFPESGSFTSNDTITQLGGQTFLDPCTVLASETEIDTGENGTSWYNSKPYSHQKRAQITTELLRCLVKEVQRVGGTLERVEEGLVMRERGPVSRTLQNEEEFQQYLPQGYNRLEVPLPFYNPKQEPLHVDFFLNFAEVMDFNEVDHYLSFDIELIAGWTDWKIKEHSAYLSSSGEVYLSGDFLDKIWTPDFFFEQIQSVTKPNVGVTPRTIVLERDTGYIKFKTRMLLNLYCDFHFFHYPADTQECRFTMRSYSYTTKLLNISWFSMGTFLHRTYDYNFEYQIVSVGRKEEADLRPWVNLEEKYATLFFVVKARRKLSYHLVQTFIPSVLLAVVTWLCFLIPRSQSEVRVGVAMTTLLTMTAMFNSVRASSPVVSYMKAIDCWMLSCIFFLFCTLAGFLTIAWFSRTQPLIVSSPNSSPKMKMQRVKEKVPLCFKDDLEQGSPLKQEETERSGILTKSLDKKLDQIFMIIVPSSFLIFVTSFWTWLLVVSNYQGWALDETYNQNF